MHILKSENTDQLFEAFVKFHSQLGTVVKDKKVSAGRAGTYKYADLASLQDYVRPILAENNLAVSQLVTPDGVVSMLMHSSGQFLGGVTKIIMDSTGAKAQGSAITYARRYGYAALLDLAQDDDDGQTADGYPGINRPKGGPAAAGSTGSSKPTGASKGSQRSSAPTSQATGSKNSSQDSEGGGVEKFRKILSELHPEDREGHLDLLNQARDAGLGVKAYQAFTQEVKAHHVAKASN